MPRGDKSSYSGRQKRKAGKIEEGYERKGVSKKTAQKRAWATVNKQEGGAAKKGSSSRKTARKKTATKKGTSTRRKTAAKKGGRKTAAKKGGRKTARKKTASKRASR